MHITQNKKFLFIRKIHTKIINFKNTQHLSYRKPSSSPVHVLITGISNKPALKLTNIIPTALAFINQRRAKLSLQSNFPFRIHTPPYTILYYTSTASIGGLHTIAVVVVVVKQVPIHSDKRALVPAVPPHHYTSRLSLIGLTYRLFHLAQAFLLMVAGFAAAALSLSRAFRPCAGTSAKSATETEFETRLCHTVASRLLHTCVCLRVYACIRVYRTADRQIDGRARGSFACFFLPRLALLERWHPSSPGIYLITLHVVLRVFRSPRKDTYFTHTAGGTCYTRAARVFFFFSSLLLCFGFLPTQVYGCALSRVSCARPRPPGLWVFLARPFWGSASGSRFAFFFFFSLLLPQPAFFCFARARGLGVHSLLGDPRGEMELLRPVECALGSFSAARGVVGWLVAWTRNRRGDFLRVRRGAREKRVEPRNSGGVARVVRRNEDCFFGQIRVCAWGFFA